MVDFKGLDDVVANLEKEVTVITAELEKVKQQIERVKTEYHEESGSCKKGMREFLLEEAGKLDKSVWKPAEAAQEEIANMRDVMKRKVSEKEVVFVCTFDGGKVFYCDDRIVYLADAVQRGIYSIIGVDFIIKYSEIKDLNKGTAEPISLFFGSNNVEKLEEVGQIAIITSEDEEKIMTIDAFPTEKVKWVDAVYSILWDIYEFING